MNSAIAEARAAPDPGRKIRVMIVDDAVVARSMMARWLEAEPDVKIAGSLRTGREAVDQLEANDPDVVLLDIDMPDLDGIAALPLLLGKKRDLVVIMVSTLTRRSAELSFRALALGATDYIPKPETTYEAMTSAAFRRELIDKVRNLGRKRMLARPLQPRTAEPSPRPRSRPAAPVRAPDAIARRADSGEIVLRSFSPAQPRALVIGSSTGGPQALTTLLEKLTAAIDRAPVLITQHMPPTFTAVLAEHLSRVSSRGAHEGENGEPVLAGGIYLAPGGRHMRVIREGEQVKIAIGDDEPVNFCKPAVDPLFSTAAAVWGAGVLALVLTGMGADGMRGASEIVAAGGSVIAQDEATSVVWGMPRAVAQAGLCSAVLPLDRIAARIVDLLSGDRS